MEACCRRVVPRHVAGCVPGLEGPKADSSFGVFQSASAGREQLESDDSLCRQNRPDLTQPGPLRTLPQFASPAINKSGTGPAQVCV